MTRIQLIIVTLIETGVILTILDISNNWEKIITLLMGYYIFYMLVLATKQPKY